MSLKKLAYALIMIGAINWGLIGLIETDLIDKVLGEWPEVVRVVYSLVGISAVYMLLKHRS